MSIDFSLLTLLTTQSEQIINEVRSPAALDIWDNAARSRLPVYVKIWLGLMVLNNIAALAFVKNHVAARWVFVGFILSHLSIIVLFGGTDTPILAGQVSLFHVICWTPGFIILLLKRAEMKWISAYAIWAWLSILFYLGSMSVDIRDAYIFIQHGLSG